MSSGHIEREVVIQYKNLYFDCGIFLRNVNTVIIKSFDRNMHRVGKAIKRKIISNESDIFFETNVNQKR